MTSQLGTAQSIIIIAIRIQMLSVTYKRYDLNFLGLEDSCFFAWSSKLNFSQLKTNYIIQYATFI